MLVYLSNRTPANPTAIQRASQETRYSCPPGEQSPSGRGKDYQFHAAY